MTTYEIALRLKSIQGPMELRKLAKDAIAALNERDEHIVKLKRELDTYQNGYQGACITCEPVGERNKDLREKAESLEHGLDAVTETANELSDENGLLRYERDELREEIGQYKWLLEQAKIGNPAPQDVAKQDGGE